MKRIFRPLAYLVLTLCLAYYLTGLISDLRRFAEHDNKQLYGLARQLQIEWGNAQQGRASQAMLKRIKNERKQLAIEMFIRRYHLDLLCGLAAGLAFLFLLFDWFGQGKAEINKTRRKVADDFSIAELKPGEAYVDEYEMSQKAEVGFANREAAIRWLQDDLANVCEYCKGKMSNPPGTEKAAVQLITFYKTVPTGAKDLRVILGSYWFPKHAPEVVCGNCGNRLKR